MINNKFLKSARKIKEEDSPLDPEDLENYQNQMLKSAENSNQRKKL